MNDLMYQRILKRLVIAFIIIGIVCWLIGIYGILLVGVVYVFYGVFMGARKSRLKKPQLTNDPYLNLVLKVKQKIELPEFCLLLTHQNDTDFESHLFYSLLCIILLPIAVIYQWWVKDYRGISVYLPILIAAIPYFKGYYQKYESTKNKEFSKRLYVEINKEHLIYGKDEQKVALKWQDIHFDLYAKSSHSPLEIHINSDDKKIIIEQHQLTVDIYQFYEALSYYCKLAITHIRP